MKNKICEYCGKLIENAYRSKKYHKRCSKKVIKNYENKPETKLRKKRYMIEYRKIPYVKEKRKEYYQNNKDQILKKYKTYHKEYYEKNIERERAKRRKSSLKWFYKNKEIILEKKRLYYQNNKEKEKLRTKNYYKNNKEIIKIKGIKYSREYYQKPGIREKSKKRCKEYYYKSIIKMQDMNKKYRQTKRGKEAYRRHNMKRRAIKNNIIEIFTQKEWEEKIRQMNGICPICKNKFDNNYENRKITLDHIIPISKALKGFVYTINDIQPICKGCNSSKGDK